MFRFILYQSKVVAEDLYSLILSLTCTTFHEKQIYIICRVGLLNFHETNFEESCKGIFSKKLKRKKRNNLSKKKEEERRIKNWGRTWKHMDSVLFIYLFIYEHIWGFTQAPLCLSKWNIKEENKKSHGSCKSSDSLG